MIKINIKNLKYNGILQQSNTDKVENCCIKKPGILIPGTYKA